MIILNIGLDTDVLDILYLINYEIINNLSINLLTIKSDILLLLIGILS